MPSAAFFVLDGAVPLAAGAGMMFVLAGGPGPVTFALAAGSRIGKGAPMWLAATLSEAVVLLLVALAGAFIAITGAVYDVVLLVAMLWFSYLGIRLWPRRNSLDQSERLGALPGPLTTGLLNITNPNIWADTLTGPLATSSGLVATSRSWFWAGCIVGAAVAFGVWVLAGRSLRAVTVGQAWQSWIMRTGAIALWLMACGFGFALALPR